MNPANDWSNFNCNQFENPAYADGFIKQVSELHAQSKSEWIRECISSHLDPKDLWIKDITTDDPPDHLTKASKRVAKLGFRIREYPDKSVMMKGGKVIGVFTFKV